MTTLDDLSTRQCIQLAALLGAQECRLAVTPTRRLTEHVVAQLAAQGVIEYPVRATTMLQSHTTPCERISWACSWHERPYAGLMVALGRRLKAVPFDDDGVSVRSQIWDELILAEAESFFERQLLRHQFDGAWSEDLAFAHRDSPKPLSIAQWRYCSWAAVRHGAAVAMRQVRRDDASIRETLYVELRRRADRLAAGHWQDCALPPFDPTPRDALGQLVALVLLQSTDLYWTQAASIHALEALAAAYAPWQL